MVEIMVSLTVASIFMSSLFMAQDTGQKVASRATHEDETQARLSRAVTRVASELRSIIDTSIWEDLSGLLNETNILTFQGVESIDEGVMVPGVVTRLEYVLEAGELLDDVDNDGDGLIDEGSVVLTRDPTGPNEISVTLCRNVREYYQGESLDFDDENDNGLVDEAGFHIQRIGDQLIVRLTVEDVDLRGDVVIKSAEALIRIRN